MDPYPIYDLLGLEENDVVDVLWDHEDEATNQFVIASPDGRRYVVSLKVKEAPREAPYGP